MRNSNKHLCTLTLLVVSLVFVISGCSNGRSPTVAETPDENTPDNREQVDSVETPPPSLATEPLKTLDLSRYGVPLKMDIPASSDYAQATARGVEILKRPNYQVFVQKAKDALPFAKLKEENKDISLEVVADTEDKIIRKINKYGETRFALHVQVKVSGETYLISSGRSRSQEDLDTVLNSIDSIQASENPQDFDESTSYSNAPPIFE